MSLKRKADNNFEVSSNKKHTLDSDEEDSDRDAENVMNESDIEGEEYGVAGLEDEVRITPFNMKEELEEGYFDKSGHYHWKKDNQIQDNWLDNIDWVKVACKKDKADSTAPDETKLAVFNSKEAYVEIIKMMEPNETIKQTLQRLGKKNMKLSSVERLRQKKQGIVDEASINITKLTQLANEILVNTGNMDVYEETYATIELKIGSSPSTSNQGSSKTVDMYADDFEVKIDGQPEPQSSETVWEYKYNEVNSEIYGPFSSRQMHVWQDTNHFKKPVLVRKFGSDERFYSIGRIDFELYM